jgi:pimeloyl-ACP methyl ester carboxylesterase
MGYNPAGRASWAGLVESKRSEAIVLIHGLWMTGAEMRVLGGRLEESGFRVRYFRYRSWRGGLAQAADALRDFVEATEGKRVHLVGHSLGGIVIAKMLEGPLSRQVAWRCWGLRWPGARRRGSCPGAGSGDGSWAA